MFTQNASVINTPTQLTKKEKKIYFRAVRIPEYQLNAMLSKKVRRLESQTIGFYEDRGPVEVKVHIFCLQALHTYSNQMITQYFVYYPLLWRLYSCSGIDDVAKVIQVIRKVYQVGQAEEREHGELQHLAKSLEASFSQTVSKC